MLIKHISYPKLRTALKKHGDVLYHTKDSTVYAILETILGALGKCVCVSTRAHTWVHGHKFFIEYF